MKKNKSKIKIDPYGAELLLIFTDDVPGLRNKFYLDLNGDTDKDTYDAIFLADEPDTRKYIVILDYKASPGDIAHEVSHLTTMLLNTCGVNTVSNDEPNSYLIGFLVDKIWKKLIKLNKIENDNIRSTKEGVVQDLSPLVRSSPKS